MKTILTLCIGALLLSCGGSVVYNGDTTDNKKNIIKFSKHIETYIERHVIGHFLEHVEPNYKKDQLTQMLKSDTTQFVNEFFCGKNSEMKHTCVDFNKIKSIDIIEIIPQKGETYKLRYLIVNENGEEIISEVFLFTDQKVYQLFSAVG